MAPFRPKTTLHTARTGLLRLSMAAGLAIAFTGIAGVPAPADAQSVKNSKDGLYWATISRKDLRNKTVQKMLSRSRPCRVHVRFLNDDQLEKLERIGTTFDVSRGTPAPGHIVVHDVCVFSVPSRSKKFSGENTITAASIKLTEKSKAYEGYDISQPRVAMGNISAISAWGGMRTNRKTGKTVAPRSASRLKLRNFFEEDPSAISEAPSNLSFCRYKEDGVYLYGVVRQEEFSKWHCNSATADGKGFVPWVTLNDEGTASKYGMIWADDVAPVAGKHLSLSGKNGKNAGCLAIRSVHKVADMAKAKGNRAIVQKCYTSISQNLYIDYFDRVRFLGDMCLDIAGASRKNGAKVHAWPCHNKQNQKWYLTKRGELRSGLSHKCLTVSAGKRELSMQTCGAQPKNRMKVAANQKWSTGGTATRIRIVQADNNPPLSVKMPGYKHRMCMERNGGCEFFFARPSKSGKGRSTTVNIGHATGTQFVRWTEGACRKKTNPNCDFGYTSKGAELAFVTKTSVGHSDAIKALGVMLKVRRSGKCIDSTSSKKPGKRVHAWKCDENNRRQRFDLVKIKGQKNQFRLKSKASGLCLDVLGRAKKNGGKVVQWGCNRKSNQVWELYKQDKKEWFSIRAKHSGKCLDLVKGGKKNGTQFHQWSCNTKNPNQRFKFQG